MPVPGAIIVPHPPLIVPSVGRGQERAVQKTIDAYRAAARQAAAWDPEVLVVTSPHQTLYADYFHISPGGSATGAFVSLHAHGQLRGCIGTTGPTTASVAREIVQNVLSAGLRDPRSPPVSASELESLEYSVDVLGAPEPIASPAELDVKRYGAIVSSGGRRGLLLPDLEGGGHGGAAGGHRPAEGRHRPREQAALERFEVVQHT